MHAPDGFLNAGTAVATGAISAGTIGIALRQVKQTLSDKAVPLAGITVVAVEQAVAAPLATRHLADWGARVIKIERPGAGDFARAYDTRVKGLSAYFVWLNRSKESLTLDLKHAAGQQVLEQLLSTADIFLHNLAPGAVDRLGFEAQRLQAAHP